MAILSIFAEEQQIVERNYYCFISLKGEHRLSIEKIQYNILVWSLCLKKTRCELKFFLLKHLCEI